MKPRAQYCAHCPQPMHMSRSITAWPVDSSLEIAEQPRVMHTPHAVHWEETSNAGSR